tara:strand:- start:3333 stop:3668 length:336 start_codon:yes stop_codon:yes gene_type:complete
MIKKSRKKPSGITSVYLLSYNNIELYIGMSKDPLKRLKQHQYSLNKGDLKPLYNHLRESGITILDLDLSILKTFKTRVQAKRYECYILLKQYFENDFEMITFNKIPNISDR